MRTFTDPQQAPGDGAALDPVCHPGFDNHYVAETGA
jgi:hypothetical protein